MQSNNNLTQIYLQLWQLQDGLLQAYRTFSLLGVNAVLIALSIISVLAADLVACAVALIVATVGLVSWRMMWGMQQSRAYDVGFCQWAAIEVAKVGESGQQDQQVLSALGNPVLAFKTWQKTHRLPGIFEAMPPPFLQSMVRGKMRTLYAIYQVAVALLTLIIVARTGFCLF